MLTMRQIERWWNAKSYARLLDELCQGRAEGVAGIRELLDGPEGVQRNAAAAITIIRATELRQEAHPLIGKLIGLLLATQNAAGGWGDDGNGPVLTALAARALALTGTGPAVDAALNYLADAQTADGEWTLNESPDCDRNPAVHSFAGAAASTYTLAGPEVTTTTDLAVTAFVLYQLATIRRPVAALIIDGALAGLADAHAIDRPADTQLNTLRRRIEARRVLAPAA